MSKDLYCVDESFRDGEASRLADEYIVLAQAGRNPDPEEFLARNPRLEQELRPVVEGAARLSAEIRRYCQASGTELPDALSGE